MQAILTFIITNIIHHDDIKELENLFKKLDSNQDGKLSKEELVEGYKAVYAHLDDAAINTMVDTIIQNTDYNFSGQIDYTEYLVAAINKDKLITRDKLTKTFQSFDLVDSDHQNGDGFITKEEWEKCFGNTKLSTQDWTTFLEEVDSNKDGTISLDEFFLFLERNIIR